MPTRALSYLSPGLSSRPTPFRSHWRSHPPQNRSSLALPPEHARQPDATLRNCVLVTVIPILPRIHVDRVRERHLARYTILCFIVSAEAGKKGTEQRRRNAPDPCFLCARSLADLNVRWSKSGNLWHKTEGMMSMTHRNSIATFSASPGTRR